MTKPSTRKPTVLESACGEFRNTYDYATLTVTRVNPFVEMEPKTFSTMEALRAHRDATRETFLEMARQSRED